VSLRLALLTAALFAAPRIQGTWGVAYAPLDVSAPRPAIVFLHGMWSSPEDACPSFETAATRFGFLVCPRGNAALGDGKMWSGSYADAVRTIHPAIDAAGGLAPGKLDRAGGGTLLGFSNGAYFAAEVAMKEPGRWTGLVLLSMKLDLDARALQAAGVRRVVLAAGDADAARAPMQSLAQRLNTPAVEVRFMSLGAIGHGFPPDMDQRMCEAIAWARDASVTECRR
jgi:pimeloyl-ACP methyl ester carboxylesterase